MSQAAAHLELGKVFLLNALEPAMHLTDDSKGSEPWYEIRPLYWAILLMVAGVCFMMFVSKGVFRTAGEAAFIAGVLTFTVDPYLKKKFQREAAQDIFHHLLGHGLPLDIKEHLREIVLNTNCYRRNMTVMCEPRIEGDGVTLDLDLTWEIVNPGRREIKYKQVLQFEESENPFGISASMAVQGSSYSEVPAFTPMKGEPQVVEWVGPEVSIEPEERNIIHYFAARYSVTLPKNFFHVINFGMPTSGLVVTLRNVPVGLEVNVTPAKIQSKTKWIYQRLFMPTDHIQIRWKESPHEGQPKP